MTSYQDSAYSDEQVLAAIKEAGLSGTVKEVVAKLSTRGMTLTQIAEKLALNPQRFWAYYQGWCHKNAQPLRLNERTT